MLQPFKRITIEMKDATNQGLYEVTGKNIDPVMRLKDPEFYYPVKLEGTTAGKKHMGVPATLAANRVIGVIGETFSVEGVGTQIIVSGIVPMKAGAVIAAGDPVMVSAKGQIVKATKVGATSGFFGVALKGAKAMDIVDVLLKIGGGIPIE